MRGATPIDFVTLGIMQGGIFGLAVLAFALGALMTIYEKWLTKTFPDGIREMIYAYSVVYVSALSVLYADPLHIITRNFHLIVGISILIFLRRFFQKKSFRMARSGNAALPP